MGNDKKNKNKSSNKQSIPVQEFVNSFTEAFTLLLVELLEGLFRNHNTNTFIQTLLNSHVPGGDRVKSNVHMKKFCF